MLQVTCTRCNGRLWPFDANGGCATCGIRPDERRVSLANHEGGAFPGWEWRTGTDGKRRAVWRKA